MKHEIVDSIKCRKGKVTHYSKFNMAEANLKRSIHHTIEIDTDMHPVGKTFILYVKAVSTLFAH